MFRGSLLIANKILSYSDFINMPYDRFCKIEATYQLVNDLKYQDSSNSTKSKNEVKQKLSGLPTANISDLSEDERRFLNASWRTNVQHGIWLE